MLTQQKTTKLYQIFQVCTQRCNLRNPIRHCPSSGLNTLFIRLDSVVFSLQSDHINLSYQGGCRKEDNNQQRKPTRSTCHQYQQKLQNHPQQLSTLFRYKVNGASESDIREHCRGYWCSSWRTESGLEPSRRIWKCHHSSW